MMAGKTRSTEHAARRVSFSELLGRIPSTKPAAANDDVTLLGRGNESVRRLMAATLGTQG
jgi:hypothetical protein